MLALLASVLYFALKEQSGPPHVQPDLFPDLTDQPDPFGESAVLLLSLLSFVGEFLFPRPFGSRTHHLVSILLYPIVNINVSPCASLKKIPVRVFHPRLTAGDPGHLAPIVVGRLEKAHNN